MTIVGLSQRSRRILATLIGFVALAALVVPTAQASGPAFKPAILDVTGWTMAGPSAGGVALAGLPLPTSGDNIGPGSYLLIHRTDGDFICTANFVWSGTGGTYLGAAGHCFLPPADDALVAQPRVEVCVSDCLFGGQLGTVIVGTWKDLGTVAYARQSQGGVDVGNDFGIVKIPADLLSSVRHSVPVWGGPTTSTGSVPTLGDRVCLYGNGTVVGEVFATKARFGISGEPGADNKSWYATIPSLPGDSGSAVVNCPALTGTSPVGILTHLATNGTGIIAGTTAARAKAMAAAAGLTIDIVP